MIGQKIAHYAILEKLGEGGMGVVYKAHDTKLDRVVALKFLRLEQSADEIERTRFLQEARAASALNHPNVCGIHAIGEHEGQTYIDMEFVAGVTLRARCALRLPAIPEALEFATHIGEALQEAHAKGIVHRDVKGDNIMVNERNEIKVMDFGLAKVRGSLNITRTSSTIGTLATMAPEQLQGGESDARSDIFSFGIVLYELFTGKMPFRGEHEAALIYSILNEDPAPPSGIRPDLPPDLDRIILRAIEKDPTDRYQHVDDMVSEIRRLRKVTGRISRSAIADAIAPQGGSPASPTGPVPLPVAVGAPPDRRKRRMMLIAGACVIVAAGIGAYLYLGKQQPEFDSLAVMPFVNTDTEASTEYLSDGITESIINSLSRIPQLRVVPRSTVFRYKGKEMDPQEIGAKLNVKSVLMGRIVRHGEELNVQLDLVDVGHQSQIWGNQYRRNIADVLVLQDDIVAEITQRLRLTLETETRRNLAKRSTENVEAYQLYLQGQFYWNKRQANDIATAIDFFNRALALDPHYALAYVGLANSYLIQEQYAGLPARETFPKAELAAKKALEIDNSIAEAHTSLAFVKEVAWDWKGAEEEYKTAIALNPKYATTYHWYSIMLRCVGRVRESEEIVARAHDADPMSLIIAANVADALRYRGEYAQSLSKYQAILEIDSTFAMALNRIGRVYRAQGNYPAALNYFTRARIASHDASQYYADEASGYSRLGRTAEAEAILRILRDRYERHASSAFLVSAVYAGMGKNSDALDWLERDLKDHTSWLMHLRYEESFESLRAEPRFRAMLKTIYGDMGT